MTNQKVIEAAERYLSRQPHCQRDADGNPLYTSGQMLRAFCAGEAAIIDDGCTPPPLSHLVAAQMRRIAELEADLENARLEIEGSRHCKGIVGDIPREKCGRLEAAIKPINPEAAELIGLVPYFIDRIATWRGIAAGMGYEPLAHKDVQPVGKWLNDRIAMFRAKVVEAAHPAPVDHVTGKPTRAEEIVQTVRAMIAAENKHARLIANAIDPADETITSRDEADLLLARLTSFTVEDCDVALRLIRRRSPAPQSREVAGK